MKLGMRIIWYSRKALLDLFFPEKVQEPLRLSFFLRFLKLLPSPPRRSLFTIVLCSYFRHSLLDMWSRNPFHPFFLNITFYRFGLVHCFGIFFRLYFQHIYVVIQKCKQIPNFIGQLRYSTKYSKNNYEFTIFWTNVNKQLKSAEFYLRNKIFEISFYLVTNFGTRRL